MTPEEVRSAINAGLADKVVLSWWPQGLVILLAGAAAYLGAYLKRKGENLATHEDIERLTREVEDIKSTYSRQIEDYKAEIKAREQAAKMAEFFTEWLSPQADKVKLNRYAMELSLWLPYDLHCRFARCVTHEKGAPTYKEILVDIRKHLLKDKAGALIADNIVHFA